MQTENKFSWEQFAALPIIGILRGLSEKHILQIAEVYCKVGFSSLEVTMNTVGVTRIITQLRKTFPSLNVGAGTVCDMEDLKKARGAGATFIVTPNLDINVINACCQEEVAIFPGAYTPTEVVQAWQSGASAVKLFPASQLGPAYIKDLLAPLSNIPLVPTGGVSRENIKAYFKAGVTGVGMGNSLFPKSVIERSDFQQLAQHLLSIKNEITDFSPLSKTLAPRQATLTRRDKIVLSPDNIRQFHKS